MNQSLFKRNVKNIAMISSLLVTMSSATTLATSELTATLDVTPPMGKVAIQNATVINNINYVDSANIEVLVDAKDDMCELEEIKYYISTSPISKDVELPDATAENPDGWKNYTPGVTEQLVLPDLTTTNKIYCAFKDKVGNTSIIYNGTNVTFEIVYHKNADDAVMFTSTVATTGYHGMNFIVTTQAPTRDGYYFAGWSTNPNATEASFKKGEIIPAEAFKGGPGIINLYAVWSQSSNGLVMLSDVVEIGDYVNYPVTYENVETKNYNTPYTSPYHGWRVISKDVDLDGNESIGTVNLVSAGTPLTYYTSGYENCAYKEEEDLTINFLTTPLNNGAQLAYQKSGFLLYKTLTETFTNKFTAMKEDGVTPQVRSINGEDICRITGSTSLEDYPNISLSKYEELFNNNSCYWTASVKASYILYAVVTGGIANNRSGCSYGVRPVVSLKKEIVATGVDRVGAWNIEIAD